MSRFPDRPPPAGARRVVRVTQPVAGVAVVTIDRPDSLNALDLAVVDGLSAALTNLADSDDVSVVVLTGAGESFSAGADLSVLSEALASEPPLDLMRRCGIPLRALAHLPQLTIAAVNGPAIGGGWGLAMACDLRIAGPRARFGATFARLGLGPDYGLSATLPRAIGRQRALELLMTGRFISAEQAARIGLVAEVADDVLSRALELATDIVTVPARAIRSIKATLREAENAGMDEVVDRIEAGAQAALFEHTDFGADAAAWISRHRSTPKPPGQ